MTVVVAGWNSAIAKAFVQMVSDAGMMDIRRQPRDAETMHAPWTWGTANRYLICTGVMLGRSAAEHSSLSEVETWRANYGLQVQWIRSAIEADDSARVCVIGSESAYRSCYDPHYAGAKAALHRFVETTRLRTDKQQLVAISPSIVEGTGMHARRHDFGTPELAKREEEHPKGRFITPAEVAALAYFLLFEDWGYISGTVVRMHGGQR